MAMTKDRTPEREEIEMLLPWHAAGTLSREDAERVEEALKNNAELARHFEAVREERAETVHLNEALGSPTRRPMLDLFAAIDRDLANREAGLLRRRDLAGRICAVLFHMSPRTLAWSAAAVLAILVLQTAILASVFIDNRLALFDVASEQGSPARAGTFAIVRFRPSATAAEIDRFLRAHQASVVDGPKADGLYRIRVSASDLPKNELTHLMTRMEQEKTVVGFIAPAE
jgi:hypothetical protein